MCLFWGTLCWSVLRETKRTTTLVFIYVFGGGLCPPAKKEKHPPKVHVQRNLWQKKKSKWAQQAPKASSFLSPKNLSAWVCRFSGTRLFKKDTQIDFGDSSQQGLEQEWVIGHGLQGLADAPIACVGNQARAKSNGLRGESSLLTYRFCFFYVHKRERTKTYTVDDCFFLVCVRRSKHMSKLDTLQKISSS